MRAQLSAAAATSIAITFAAGGATDIVEPCATGTATARHPVTPPIVVREPAPFAESAAGNPAVAAVTTAKVIHRFAHRSGCSHPGRGSGNVARLNGAGARTKVAPLDGASVRTRGG